jgi:tetratricopeptide (TPR) repeat protein
MVLRIFHVVQSNRLKLPFFLLLLMVLSSGCSHFSEEYKAKPTFEEANDYFNQGDFQASLGKYDQIIAKFPSTEDRVLFQMGIIYAHPNNEQKDYQKSIQCFQKLIKDHPASEYRKDSEMMIFYINNGTVKDMKINTQQKEIDTLQQEVKSKDSEIVTLQKQIQALEEKITALALQKAVVDKILIEKKQRRLMLISKGEVLKTYKIALGGNPEGPKERHGDNKTPEGIYTIDSRNTNSLYHLSLHISYPNEKDKRRAKELGVAPGGDIMIHGIKNGFSWVGGSHTEADWTKGCIAVTDEEIEEISKVVPNGTTVEIKP